MDATPTHSCANCESLRAELAVLRESHTALQAQIVTLLAKVAELEAALAASKKNSSNSSKPPSSDIVKPPRPSPTGTKRKIGAQKGHPRHERTAFPAEEVDRTLDYALEVCPACHCATQVVDQPPRVLQQVDLAPRPITVIEHRAHVRMCPCCRKTFVGQIPREIQAAGLAGPRLTALVAFLKGGCHCSFSTIRKFLRDVVGVTLSRGYLRKLCGKVSGSLDAMYQELLNALPGQSLLNVDETGHREQRARMWTWCFRASLFTLFKIDPTRSSDVLHDVLGTEFQGVLGCDYYGAYRKYMRNCNVLVQFCLAHLLRDIRFLAQHPHPRNRVYGERLLTAMRELFGVIHRREEFTAEAFAIALQNAGDELHAEAIYQVPATSEAKNLARRFHLHGESYLRFITTPGIEPTNNVAEQAIRFVVLDRVVTQGTRGEAGRRWSERIWTVLATCAQQGRSMFTFVLETVTAHFAGDPTPSLMPNTS